MVTSFLKRHVFLAALLFAEVSLLTTPGMAMESESYDDSADGDFVEVKRKTPTVKRKTVASKQVPTKRKTPPAKKKTAASQQESEEQRRPLTQDDKNKINDLIKKGLSDSKIGRIMKRDRSIIRRVRNPREASRRNVSLSDMEKEEAIKYKISGMKTEEIAGIYGCGKSTLVILFRDLRLSDFLTEEQKERIQFLTAKEWLPEGIAKDVGTTPIIVSQFLTSLQNQTEKREEIKRTERTKPQRKAKNAEVYTSQSQKSESSSEVPFSEESESHQEIEIDPDMPPARAMKRPRGYFENSSSKSEISSFEESESHQEIESDSDIPSARSMKCPRDPRSPDHSSSEIHNNRQEVVGQKREREEDSIEERPAKKARIATDELPSTKEITGVNPHEIDPQNNTMVVENEETQELRPLNASSDSLEPPLWGRGFLPSLFSEEDIHTPFYF